MNVSILILTWCLHVAVLGALDNAPGTNPAAQRDAELARSLVTIFAFQTGPSPGAQGARGTGFLLDTPGRRCVLTARHVIDLALRSPATATVRVTSLVPPSTVSEVVRIIVDRSSPCDVALLIMPASLPASMGAGVSRTRPRSDGGALVVASLPGGLAGPARVVHGSGHLLGGDIILPDWDPVPGCSGSPVVWEDAVPVPGLAGVLYAGSPSPMRTHIAPVPEWVWVEAAAAAQAASAVGVPGPSNPKNR